MPALEKKRFCNSNIEKLQNKLPAVLLRVLLECVSFISTKMFLILCRALLIETLNISCAREW